MKAQLVSKFDCCENDLECMLVIWVVIHRFW